MFVRAGSTHGDDHARVQIWPASHGGRAHSRAAAAQMPQRQRAGAARWTRADVQRRQEISVHFVRVGHAVLQGWRRTRRAAAKDLLAPCLILSAVTPPRPSSPWTSLGELCWALRRKARVKTRYFKRFKATNLPACSLARADAANQISEHGISHSARPHPPLHRLAQGQGYREATVRIGVRTRSSAGAPAASRSLRTRDRGLLESRAKLLLARSELEMLRGPHGPKQSTEAPTALTAASYRWGATPRFFFILAMAFVRVPVAVTVSPSNQLARHVISGGGPAVIPAVKWNGRTVQLRPAAQLARLELQLVAFDAWTGKRGSRDGCGGPNEPGQRREEEDTPQGSTLSDTQATKAAPCHFPAAFAACAVGLRGAVVVGKP
ncbi:hypothetical protein T492DRAFT_1149215 [Pavlovales sp. CCMP2436]|nr:hypothetical protein T492DRAFT_1149215 [Pavlovales sp. CCMP2436]